MQALAQLDTLFISPIIDQALRLDPTNEALVTADGSERWPLVHRIPDFVVRQEPDRFGEAVRVEGWVGTDLACAG